MNTDETQWSSTTPPSFVHSNEVHVLRACLDLTALQRESLLKNLSTDEVERAGRFRFERDRNRFIAAHGILRDILGRYLGKKAHELMFEYTSYGKPILATGPGCDNLHFNLSHSGAFALYAVSPGKNIGVDIECIRNDVSVEQIARRFFSRSEIDSMEKIHEDRRAETFFRYWTRKEAFLKAMGEGISFPMEECDVSSISTGILSPLTFVSDKIESSRWCVQDLFPGAGYAGAIAVEGGDCNLSCWDYSAL